MDLIARWFSLTTSAFCGFSGVGGFNGVIVFIKYSLGPANRDDWGPNLGVGGPGIKYFNFVAT